MNTVDHHLAEVAARRHGIFRTDHVDELGMSRSRLYRMVRSGRAFRVHHGVYSLGHPPTSLEARRIAAVDAAGPGAALSGRAAADHLRIERRPVTCIEVIVDRRHRPIDGVGVHETCSLPEADVMVVRGIRVLRVERLLVELADEHDEGRLCAWLDEARHRRLFSRRRLEAVMARHRSRRGHARLGRALAILDNGGAGSRSRWEERVARRVLAPRGVAREECTTTVIGGISFEPDVHFPGIRLVVEIDGPDHDRPNRRREDERRDRQLAAVDVATIRIHWTDEDAGVRRANDEIRHRTATLRT